MEHITLSSLFLFLKIIFFIINIINTKRNYKRDLAFRNSFKRIDERLKKLELRKLK